MWEDLTQALLNRLNTLYSATGQQFLISDPDLPPAESLRKKAKQMEADMDRYRQVFRFIQADRHEQAYNLLDQIGLPVDGTTTTPTEPATDPAAIPATDPTATGG